MRRCQGSVAAMGAGQFNVAYTSFYVVRLLRIGRFIIYWRKLASTPFSSETKGCMGILVFLQFSRRDR